MESHLSEDVKQKIDQGAKECAVAEWSIGQRGFKQGAEFGYRLALQSKEEEVTARTMELELRYAQIEHMKEQLKAKDEIIDKLQRDKIYWQIEAKAKQ